VHALGVDVSVGRGLDLVLLDDRLQILDTRRRIEVRALGPCLEELRPDVVAIDSPPAWGSIGGSRRTERELRVFGIQSYGTPTRERDGHPFYAWMKVGFRAFEAAKRRGYTRYSNGPAKGTAMEVFPHASAVVLAGCLPPTGATKREWRTLVLESQGIRARGLRSVDQVDAALAAFTGIRALQGRSSALGDPKEGVIVLPSNRLPPRAYRRCDAPEKPGRQPHLPGLSPCRCGDPSCRDLTGGEFARGHDAKRKALLWQEARRGDEAIRELRRRGWDLPAEMR
jgi:predicted nuclease with RNAse H fold